MLVKPGTKRLLLPYNPNADPVFLRIITALERDALSCGIVVQKVGIFSTEECIPKLKTFIKEGDVILIPRSPMVMAVTSDIAHLAFRYGATIYALSSGAIEQGSAFGFSDDDTVHGTNAGKKAREILVDRKHQADVPITPAPYKPYLLINEKALKSPTLKINPLVRLLAEIENIYEHKPNTYGTKRHHEAPMPGRRGDPDKNEIFLSGLRRYRLLGYVRL